MYQCPNCGGNLKFNIPSQKLRCDNCETLIDPYDYKKDHDAEERSDYDVTVFTCPQCGGQILSTETSAAEFCSFCGASTILDSRISKEKRPDFIIPFQKTKEDCKKAYGKLMKHAIFAPKELKDSKCVDKFRGIYMPYWAFYMEQAGCASLRGDKSYRRGDYIITDHYDLRCNINAYYKGLSYDASSSFADNISETIAPYDVRGMKEFTPSILSGFYADTSDVGSDLYIDDAADFANNTSYEKVTDAPGFRSYKIQKPSNTFGMNNALNTHCKQIDSAMFPVWFLSYRKKDRVAYATVNGQTGKVTADLPVDAKKYAFGSLLLAIPIFILLNMFFTVRPTITLLISSLLSLMSSVIYLKELTSIIHRETKDDDKGYMAKQRIFDTQRSKPKKKSSFHFSFSSFFVIAIWVFMAFSFFASAGAFTGSSILMLITLVATVIVCIVGFIKFSKYSKIMGKVELPGFITPLIAVVIAEFITLVNPVSDLYYYGGTILCFIATLFTITSIINKYNILSTRKLPQFNREGGDDRA
jgi:RNase P subunit RPR2